jgi:signal transduction histidine kinase/CheY-like chemotaxis protein
MLPVIAKLRFWHVLSLLLSSAILIFGIATSMVVTQTANKELYGRIINEGKQLAKALASQAKLALLYDSADISKEVEVFFLAFTDVKGVQILRPDFSVLYASEFDWQLAGAGTLDAQNVALIFENEDVLKYASPVYAGVEGDEDLSPYGGVGQQELIGYVLLVQNKDTLKQINRDILKTNLLACLVPAVILMLLLLYWTARITRPLQELAATMQLSRNATLTPRIEPHGARDIIEMQQAFNNMMDRLDMREADLKKARDEAFELAKVKSDFAANVSHELRTPLNGILGMLELLDTQGLDAEQVKYLSLARESAQNLLVLINNVLDFSRSEAGSMELNARQFDLEEHIAGVVNLLGMQAQKKSVDLCYRIEQPPGYYLIADDLRLRQILVNLVGNAIKFTHVGGVLIEAEVKPGADSTVELFLSVSDTGIGISESQQARIFEAFSQADNSTTRCYGGSGLGLAISRQLATLMQGKMWLESRPGKGSRFSLSIPVQWVRHGKPPMRSPDLLGKTVLSVLPNSVLASGLQYFLEDTRCDHIKVFSVLSAWHMLEKMKPRTVDLLILDELVINDEVTQLFQRPELKSSSILILACNSNVNKDSLAGQYQIQADEILLKPVTRQVMHEAVERLFAHVAPVAIPVKSSAAKPAPFQLPGRRILVVEDNAVNKLVAQGYLAPFGCEVIYADNGLECLEVLRQYPVDLILMDCQMPVMDGYEATRRIRAGEAGAADVPIIAMTANVAASDRDKCLETGMSGFVGKPLTSACMTQILQTWLSSGAPLRHVGFTETVDPDRAPPEIS